VADRDHNPGRGQALDERESARALRCDRHHADSPTRGLLEALEFVPVGVAGVFLRVRAARAVFAGQIRPFEVETRHPPGEFGVRVECLRQRREAVAQRVETVRDERRTERTDAVLAAHVGYLPHFIGREVERVEADPETAVDLRISRRFRFTETMNLELLAEGFNIFNRTNVTNVGTTAYTISGTNLNFAPNAATFRIPSEAGNSIFRERQVQLAARFQF